MKKIPKCTLLVQLIILSSIIQGSVAHLMSNQEALQLIRRNMLEVIKAVAHGPSNQSVHQAMFEQHVTRLPWLPGYIIKKNPESRIKVVNEILKPCIDEHKLTLLRLPELWRLPFIA